MAQSGHCAAEFQCPLLGVKRTSGFHDVMSVFDPYRTSIAEDRRSAPQALERCQKNGRISKLVATYIAAKSRGVIVNASL
jgi:hypothetical protein